MKKEETRSQRLVKWLADAIMTEMEKPEEEINLEFVESCENLLNTLMGEKKLSDKEINVRVNEIMKRSAKTHTVATKRKTKPSLVALIAAVVLLLSCVTVFATTPIREFVLKALDLDFNQGVTENKITYSNNGKNTIYSTIDELLEAEDLDICYPEKIAYDIEISNIFKSDTNQTIFLFEDPRVAFEINHNSQINQTQLNNAEIIEYNGHIFYLYNSSNIIVSYLEINNDLYSLSCDSKEQLLEMIYSFNFERLKQ